MNEKVIRSGKTSNILEIHNSDSIVNAYYDMSAPIQLTLAYCSGLQDDKDFYNVVSVSPNKDYFYTSRIVSDFHKFNARPELRKHHGVDQSIGEFPQFFQVLAVLKGRKKVQIIFFIF